MNKIYCKNCKYYQYDYAKSIHSGYCAKGLHRCMRNVKEKKNPIGEIIKNVGEDCFIANADLNCKHFEQKQKWYQKLLIIIKRKYQ